ncbi:MAG: ATP-grasp domain-containing protein [Patescibacteria group bacterium]
MKVLVITGGSSSERKISLLSAKNVKEALEKIGHKVRLFDLKKGYGKLKKLVKEFDVVFPVIHGEEGEGGSLQTFLSKLKVAFVGGDPKGFRQGWYKIPFKKWCDKNNISTSPWKIIPSRHSEPALPVKNLILNFGFPSVLKASSGGSSREVVILKSERDLENHEVKKLLNSKLELFVEKFLSGIEVTVGILGNRALPVVEISPPKGGWFDYKNKYSGATKEIPHAPSVPRDLQKLTKKIAENIHKKLSLGHYSRSDFIVSNGKTYVLEVNTIPGLTATSLVPKAAEAIGISYSQLVDKLIQLALGRFNLKIKP